MLDISDFSNLGLPTIGEKVVYATKPADLSRLYSTYRSILILGKGTNTVFINHKINTLLLYLDDHIQHVTDTIISVGSSLELDVFVDYCMRANLSGLECLSGIPGTIGGAVVLNSGAFGSTIADRLVSVTVYDSYTHSQIELPRNKLQMTHRNSIFRASSRYVILSAIFKLSHGIDETTHPRVMAVEQEKRNTPKLLRNTILSLRSSMPDFHTTRYVGSFFLNPSVNHMTYKNILSLYPDIVARKNGQHTYELSAGSILDALGLKGTSINHFYFHHNNANYLINTGKAKNTDLLEVIEYVSSLTMRTLNLELRPEPQLF